MLHDMFADSSRMHSNLRCQMIDVISRCKNIVVVDLIYVYVLSVS